MRPSSTLCLLVLLSALGPAPAAAHDLGQSYLFLSVYDDRMDVRVEIAAADLDRALGLALYADERLTREEVAPHLDAIRDYVGRHLGMGAAGRALPLRFTGYAVQDESVTDFLMLDYAIEGLATVPDELEVAFDVLLDLDRDHRNMLVIEHNWKTATFSNEAKVSLVFTPLARQQTLDLSSSSVLNGFWGLVKLGVWHIWIGLDHILFLLALTLPSVLRREDGRWKPVARLRPAFLNVVAIVTFFTLAHSVTLSLAALEVVRLPSRLVESIIAGSIAAAALHNLFPRWSVREWAIAFAFGLFHGFGFAGVLGEVGLRDEYMALSLFGFNVGVELGQIAIIAAAFPILYALRRRRWYIPVVLRYGSAVLIATALVWFVERALDVSFGWHLRRVLLSLGFG
ncbi:MAG: HupE/UreJ family protein [Rhodothermales bacterium]|nr:HupE/UreJ family protein [Rhodothermales bacterium]